MVWMLTAACIAMDSWYSYTIEAELMSSTSVDGVVEGSAGFESLRIRFCFSTLASMVYDLGIPLSLAILLGAPGFEFDSTRFLALGPLLVFQD
jgi:hypothetical protein